MSVTFSDWAQFGATLFLGFVAISVAIFGPSFAELAKRRYLAPKIKLEFGNQYRFCHITKKTYKVSPVQFEDFPVYYFRFSIQNDGKSLARSCEVVIQEVWTANHIREYQPIEAFWPTNLKWEGGNTRVDINPKRPPVFVDIGHICHPEAQMKYEHSKSIRVSDSDDTLRFILDLPYVHFAKIDSLFPGKHLLKLVIVGENFKPIRKQFELNWSGNWTEDENEMLSKEVVLTIADWS